MIFRPYKPRRPLETFSWGFIVVILCVWIGADLAFAAEPSVTRSTAPIRITADKLVTNSNTNTAEFSGQVRAIQDNTEITTDRLILYYKSKDGQQAGDSTGNIERIEAHGHVRIEFDNRVAVSDQAVYITSERKLTLEGPGSKVTSGQDEITGSKITFFRGDGRIALEGDAKNQVRAIIHSDQRGLN